MDSFPAALEPNLAMLVRLREILVNRSKYKPQVLVKYLTLIAEKRLYTAHHDEIKLGQIWDAIRTDLDLTDFVIELTREFFFRCRDLVPDGDSQTLLSQSLSDIVGMFVDEKSIIDKDTLELLAEDKAQAVYQANPWFAVMLLVPMCRIEEGIDPAGVLLESPKSENA